ncbi:hypothetical protein V7S43_008830 [Phytophthora oleae]|uniref:Replication factor A C-terminal domain-containing protein n=1 Tax=Phytophthora oleae TaxID=2107226 RepID=A0ABD3FJG4_9STRA
MNLTCAYGYAACPRCFTSMSARLTPSAGVNQRVQCSSCSAFSRVVQLPFKYRLKLQLLYGSTVADAVLFDEVAEALLGVPASKMQSEILPKYPNLPHVLEELLVGLRVSFSFQRQAPKRNTNYAQFTRDLKITSIEPLIPQLLPEPAATFAIKLLQQHSSGGDL